MNKEDILKLSREENRKGDEYEKSKKETASNLSYLVATICLALLTISCYLGITNGNVIINGFEFELADVLFAITLLTFLVEYGNKYVYLKQRKYLFYVIIWICGLIASFINLFK